MPRKGQNFLIKKVLSVSRVRSVMAEGGFLAATPRPTSCWWRWGGAEVITTSPRLSKGQFVAEIYL